MYNEFERTKKFLCSIRVDSWEKALDSSTTELSDISSVVLSGLYCGS